MTHKAQRDTRKPAPAGFAKLQSLAAFPIVCVGAQSGTRYTFAANGIGLVYANDAPALIDSQKFKVIQ